MSPAAGRGFRKTPASKSGHTDEVGCRRGTWLDAADLRWRGATFEFQVDDQLLKDLVDLRCRAERRDGEVSLNPFATWVTITVIVILQPYTGVTFTRAVQRVIGTVLGALLAAGLGTYFHDPRAILVIATVFVACCVALMPLNYAAFSVFLTPTFVLLAEASAGEWDLAGTRVLNTLLGGALALVGSRLLWPSPERDRFPAYAAAALRANASYLRSVFDRYDDRSHESSTAMRDARRAIGLATVNAEESLQRALSEVHGRGEALAPALTLVAYVRRFTATVAALALTRHARDGTTRAMLEPLCAAVCSALEECAQSLGGGGAPLPLTDAIAKFSPAPFTPLVRARLERLARQVGTLHDAVARLTERDSVVVPIPAKRV